MENIVSLYHYNCFQPALNKQRKLCRVGQVQNSMNYKLAKLIVISYLIINNYTVSIQQQLIQVLSRHSFVFNIMNSSEISPHEKFTTFSPKVHTALQ